MPRSAAAAIVILGLLASPASGAPGAGQRPAADRQAVLKEVDAGYIDAERCEEGENADADAEAYGDCIKDQLSQHQGAEAALLGLDLAAWATEDRRRQADESLGSNVAARMDLDAARTLSRRFFDDGARRAKALALSIDMIAAVVEDDAREQAKLRARWTEYLTGKVK